MLMRGGMVEMFGPREAVLRRVLKPVETAKAVTAEPPSGDAKQGAG
jgi:ABC-type protease/lipase transport system fused ATPase/permease subunit